MTVLKEWDGTQWVPIIAGKQGPQGAAGATGPQGPAGALQPGDDAEYVLSLQVFS